MCIKQLPREKAKGPLNIGWPLNPVFMKFHIIHAKIARYAVINRYMYILFSKIVVTKKQHRFNVNII